MRRIRSLDVMTQVCCYEVKHTICIYHHFNFYSWNWQMIYSCYLLRVNGQMIYTCYLLRVHFDISAQNWTPVKKHLTVPVHLGPDRLLDILRWLTCAHVYCISSLPIVHISTQYFDWSSKLAMTSKYGDSNWKLFWCWRDPKPVRWYQHFSSRKHNRPKRWDGRWNDLNETISVLYDR